MTLVDTGFSCWRLLLTLGCSYGLLKEHFHAVSPAMIKDTLIKSKTYLNSYLSLYRHSQAVSNADDYWKLIHRASHKLPPLLEAVLSHELQEAKKIIAEKESRYWSNPNDSKTEVVADGKFFFSRRRKKASARSIRKSRWGRTSTCRNSGRMPMLFYRSDSRSYGTVCRR